MLNSKNNIFLQAGALFLACITCHAQLSSEVNMGVRAPKPESAKEASTKEITVTGIGTTLESAEKQALASAIRQAVGAYMDSKTIIKNEEVIQDRILSVSNAFVEKYEVVGQPKKSSDGLVEITILARVKTNQVVQALKENNLISGEVAGQNLWAEASTKVMNAQDAVAMLEAKIPELIKSVVTITPLDDKGLPKMAKDSTGKEVSSTAPASVEENAASGEATLTWYLEMGIDKKYYAETLFPTLKKCLDAIMGVPSKTAQIAIDQNKCKITTFYIDGNISEISPNEFFSVKQAEANLPPKIGFNGVYDSYTNIDYYGVILIKSISKNFDSVDFEYYPSYKNQLHTRLNNNTPLCFVTIQLLGVDGEVLAKDKKCSWQPFASKGNRLVMIGPNTDGVQNSLHLLKPILQQLKVTIPIELLKEIKKIEISLDSIEPKLVLQPARR
jgi:hypothetical protein